MLDYVTQGIYFYDLETGEHTAHPNKSIEHLYNICWSKNGRWIVATVHAGMGYKHTLLAIEIDSNKIVDLKVGGCRPDLSPDDAKIAWGKSDTEICIGDIDLDSESPKITNIVTAATDELHLYHTDWSPDGRYLTFSRGPGGRTQPNGPGTNRGIAELVGVRNQWDICVIPVSGEKIIVPVTQDGMSNKEPDWIIANKEGAGH